MSKLAALLSITSQGSRLDAATHEVALNAINLVALEDVAQGLLTEQKHVVLKRLNYQGLENLDELPAGATYMMDKVVSLLVEESLEVLKTYLEEHDEDVNIPQAEYENIERLVRIAQGAESVRSSTDEKHGEKVTVEADLELPDDWELELKIEAALIAYHLPYPEVRLVTDPFDDPSIPCETVRVYVLGILWTAVGAFINQFFSERQPSITLSAAVVQLLLFPSGTLLSMYTPKWSFTVFGRKIELNPGPWTHKEQMLATIFYSVSAGAPYVLYNVHVQRLLRYYNNQWADWGYQILLILSTNFMGFGFAGIMRKFAVYPVRAIWPTILPTLALNRALMQPEKKESINGWRISRFLFFFVVFCCSFLYFWFPNYLFGALSMFNWMTWIAPANATLAIVTGSVSGLGLNPIPTFDWNIINHNSALTIPFYSQVNQYIGSLLGFCCVLGLYYTNYYWLGYMPINTSTLFNNRGTRYDINEVVDSNSLFDKEKYKVAGPPFYSAANIVVYGTFFAMYPFTFLHEVLTNYKSMWHALKNLGFSFRNYNRLTFEGFNDPQTTMMKGYKEVADWVFLVVLIVLIALAIACVKAYPSQTPVWGIFFALGMNFVFLFPLTAIYSRTGFSFGLNVLVELIVGYALPGNGLAMNFIKALGYNINGQAQNYISDQKMSHYLKIPPRAVFRCQLLSVFLASFISLAVINFMIDNVDDYCTPGNTKKFTCPNSNVFYSASVLWGIIGPKKVFGGLYPIMQYAFLIGALLPIPCIIAQRYGPKKLFRYFQPSLIMGGFLIYAPYNLTYYTGGLYASFAFMYYIKKRYQPWWEKYNYVLSGALDSGVAFSSIIIFFAVQYHDKSIKWWGNDVVYEGVDGNGSYARLNATLSAPDGYFGPRVGHFP